MLKRVQAIGSPSWVGSIGLTIAVAVTYFLAARLSLALLTEPDGVAVFWPAAGVSSGILIALGRHVRWPVAIGVLATSQDKARRNGADLTLIAAPGSMAARLLTICAIDHVDALGA